MRCSPGIGIPTVQHSLVAGNPVTDTADHVVAAHQIADPADSSTSVKLGTTPL